MLSEVKLSKADVRRALVRHHFTPCANQSEAFHRLRSIQFDPIAPVGCNHDLVLQARVPGYKIGDWEKHAYKDRKVYDGWDKCASLVPFEGWPLRRIFYAIHPQWFEQKIFIDHKDAVELIVKEITEKGPLMPRECEFQLRRAEWKGSWFGPSVTKQVLRALWHSGVVMTSGRKNGQHLYDLAKRVVPKHLYEEPVLSQAEAKRELAMERHRAMGILRPNTPKEIWSHDLMFYDRKSLISELLHREEIVPVDAEGVKAHATHEFLALLDKPSLKPRVIFIAPLDQFVWDRKMIAHLFDFDYSWEIYTPLPKRRWGYYVLPILFGDQLVARAEFWCRDGVLELREWHSEQAKLSAAFWTALEKAVKAFMKYSSSTSVTVKDHINAKVRDFFLSLNLVSR